MSAKEWMCFWAGANAVGCVAGLAVGVFPLIPIVNALLAMLLLGAVISK